MQHPIGVADAKRRSAWLAASHLRQLRANAKHPWPTTERTKEDERGSDDLGR